MRRHDRQCQLFALLKAREGGTVTLADIEKATQWRRSTARTYVSKKLLGRVLERTGRRDTFRVRGMNGRDEQGFLQVLSQSDRRRDDRLSFSPLVQSLLERSRTNAALALELFNRASLPNRVDAFVLLFGTAWEQLLKAELEHRRAGSIFEKRRRNKRRTLTFSACLEACSDLQDPVRKNLDVLRELRNEAAHLLVPETQPVLARYFQAGLLNYVARYRRFTGRDPIPITGAGLLTLALPYARPTLVQLTRRYDETMANEILDFVATLEERVAQTSDSRFAVELSCVLTLQGGHGDQPIRLVPSTDPKARTATVIEKPVDMADQYPFREKQLIGVLSERTNHCWNQYDVRAVIHLEGVKETDRSDYHYHHAALNGHLYSQAFVDQVVARYERDPDYLDRARKHYTDYRLDRRRARSSS